MSATYCSVCGARVLTNRASEKCWRHRPRPQLTRTPLKPWRRPKGDQVTADLVAYLIARDGPCIVPLVETAAEIQRLGPCQGRTTVEHVRERAAMGGPRAPSDKRHTVAACLGHIEWTKTARAKRLERDYLSVKEGISSAD